MAIRRPGRTSGGISRSAIFPITKFSAHETIMNATIEYKRAPETGAGASDFKRWFPPAR